MSKTLKIKILALILFICAALLNSSLLAKFSNDGVIEPPKDTLLLTLRSYLLIVAVTLVLNHPKWKPRFKKIAIVFTAFMLVEGSSQWLYKINTGQWAFNNYLIDSRNFPFERHPYLVGAPKKNYTGEKNGVQFKHNKFGLRGLHIDLKKKEGVTRILTLGGSTTYCVKVTQGKTWPELLDKKMGEQVEVLNLGVPGYSTSENLIQTSMLIEQFEPDMCIYYEGWNDMRHKHIKDLEPDYSNHNGLLQYNALNLPTPGRDTAFVSVKLLSRLLVSLGVLHTSPHMNHQVESSIENYSTEPDPYSLKLYKNNLRNIAVLCRVQGIEPVFIPQVLNYKRLQDPSQRRRAPTYPFVKNEDKHIVMPQYNKTLGQLAQELKILCVDDVLTYQWDEGHFVDNGHFSAEGCEVFATIISKKLKSHKAK